MQDYLFIIPIAVFLFAGVVSPGPSFILVAHTAMAKSRKEAVAVAVGMGTGATIFSLIACAGLFILLEKVQWLYLVLKSLGAAYLIYLAVKMWTSAKQPVQIDNNSSVSGATTMFLYGLFTQLSNPKTALVFASAFAAFLPQSVPEYSYFLISASAFVIDTGWYIIVAVFLSTSKAQAVFGRLKRHICRISGVLMAGMGVRLLAGN